MPQWVYSKNKIDVVFLATCHRQVAFFMSERFEHSEPYFSEIVDFKKKKYLLAVSGGVDSMVMCYLFNSWGLKFSVAHCNFRLRGKESDSDEELVQSVCKEMKARCYVTSFDTERYKKENKLSTQMAARDLRYSWFEKLKTQNGYNYVVTAHHLNDKVETFFLNLIRGTGIKGIAGMKTLQASVFRPFLSVSKEQLIEFANQNNILYREDASNNSEDYKRNKIRNRLIPVMTELNPNILETMAQNIENFNSIKEIYEASVEKTLSDEMIYVTGTDFQIDIGKLLKTSYPVQYLYEFLKRFGFNFSITQQLFEAIKSKDSTGKYFYSPTHRALIDRSNIQVSVISELTNNEGFIKFKDKNVTYPIQLTLNDIPKERLEINPDSNYAYFDLERLKFPLKIRKWKEGDTFTPFGMVGKKKISDYLIDIKLSRNEKEEVYVLLSEDTIVWVIGYRSSEKFKVSSATERVLTIKFE